MKPFNIKTDPNAPCPKPIMGRGLPVEALTPDGEHVAYFKNQAEAARALELSQSNTISRCVRGRQKTACGYKWKIVPIAVWKEFEE